MLTTNDWRKNSNNTEITPSDMMVICMARLLKYNEKVFHGLSSPIAMVSILLAKKLHAPDLIYLNITGSVDPHPVNLPYSTVDATLLNKTKSHFKLTEIFDLSARGELDTAFLSGAQIDRKGRVNNSVIGSYENPKVRLPGGAGSAVIIPTAKRTILWRTKHDKRTLVNEVDFVTADGNVTHLVTPLAVFKKIDGRLILDTIHPYTTLEEVKERTGFPLLYDEVRYTKLPTENELKTLKLVDPKRIRDIEF